MSGGPWELFQTPAAPAAAPTPSVAPAETAGPASAPEGPWTMFAAQTPAATPIAPAPSTGDAPGPDPEGTGTDNYGERPLTVHRYTAPAAPAAHDAPSGAGDSGHSGGIMDQIDAGVRAAANGMTLGYADRLAALAGAATGIGGAQGDYAGNLKGQQALSKMDAEAYPITTAAGGVAGGVAGAMAGPGSAALAAPTLLGKIAASTGLGAAAGAVEGSSTAPDLTNVGDAAQRAAGGALLGGVVGAATPGFAAGVGAGYRALAGGVGLPEGINRAAAAKLGQALEADKEGVARLGDLGPNALLPDAGPSLLGLAQGVATKPGEGKTALVTALAERNAGTNARIQSDINSALGPANSPLAVASNLKAKRAAVHNELPDIFENAPPVDVSPVLAYIGNRMNAAVGPEKAALTTARNYLMEEGANGNLMPVTNAEKVANAKSALQGLVDFGDPTIGVQPGALAKAEGTTKTVLKSLNNVLRQQVPGYSSVMDRSSHLAKTIDAIEEGQGILGGGQNAIRPDDFATRLGAATDAEKRGMQVGVRGDIDRQVGTKINDLQALKQDLQGEGGWNEQKIAQLFGQKAADALTGSVDRNQTFRNTFGKVVENSQTAQRTIASQALDSAASSGPIIPKNATVGGMLANASENILRMIADGRADFEGQKTRAAIGRILATPPSATRERELLKILGRSYLLDQNGQRLGNAAALLTSAAGREVLRQRSMAGTQ